MVLQNLLMAEKLPTQDNACYQQLTLFDGTYQDFLQERGSA
jgi:hypothetical protein